MAELIRSWGHGQKVAPPHIPADELYTRRGAATGCMLWGQDDTERMAVAPELDLSAVWDVLGTVDGFFCSSKIQTDKSMLEHPTPQYFQMWYFWALHTYRHCFVGSKPRQAQVSTGASVGWLLRDCMYFGLKGRLFANKRETANDLHGAIVTAYEELDPSIQVPLAKGRIGTQHKIEFASGGSIKIDSAEGRSPGAGTSPDRVLLTEYGEIDGQEELLKQLFPAYERRQNARDLIETTPGRLESLHRSQWNDSLNSMGRLNMPDGSTGSEYYPLFFEWWFGTEFTESVPRGFNPTAEEGELLNRCRGLTYENLQWRRKILAKGWTAQAFETKYPSSPYHGWVGTDKPTFPPELIDELLRDATSDVLCPYNFELGCSIIETPKPGTTYYIFADSAGLDGDGDPSAFTVFDQDWNEVAFFEAVEDSHKFALRLERVGEYYRCGSHAAMLIVEANESSCLGVLKNLVSQGKKINIYFAENNHMGWRATGKSVAEAEGKTLIALRDRDMTLRSTGTLQQLLSYSGTWRHKRIRGANGAKHHFDRARTIMMAGSLLPSFTKKLINKRPSRLGVAQNNQGELDLTPRPRCPPSAEAQAFVKNGIAPVIRSNSWLWQRGGK